MPQKKIVEIKQKVAHKKKIIRKHQDDLEKIQKECGRVTGHKWVPQTLEIDHRRQFVGARLIQATIETCEYCGFTKH